MQQLTDGRAMATASDIQAAHRRVRHRRERHALHRRVGGPERQQNAGIPFDGSIIPTLFGTPAVYADSHAFVLPQQSEVDRRQARGRYKMVSTILKNSLSWAEAGHIPAYLPVVESPEYAELRPAGELRRGRRLPELRPARLVHRLGLGLPDVLPRLDPVGDPRQGRRGRRHAAVRRAGEHPAVAPGPGVTTVHALTPARHRRPVRPTPPSSPPHDPTSRRRRSRSVTSTTVKAPGPPPTARGPTPARPTAAAPPASGPARRQPHRLGLRRPVHRALRAVPRLAARCTAST